MDTTRHRYGVITESAGRGAVYEGHGPQAIYHEGTDSTYVTYRGLDADPYATRFDHETHTFEDPIRIGTNPLPNEDNHGPPSICVDDDDHLLAFYGSHGHHHQVARTSDPADVSSWEELGPIDDVPSGTYPSPFSHDGDVYVFYRAGPKWDDKTYPSAQYGTIVRSSDGGRSFEDLGPIIDITDHPDELSIAYVNDVTVRDGQFHLNWLICHDHAVPVTVPSQHRSGIYHAIYDPNDGALFDLEGTRYEPPLTWSEMNNSAVEAFGRQDVNHPKHAQLPGGPTILFNHYDPPTRGVKDGTSRIEWLVAFWRDRWRLERVDDAFATHFFDGGYPRVNESDQFEAYIVTGGADASLVDGTRGGNLEVATYTGREFDRRTIVSAKEIGHPISRVSTVKNGRDEFSAIFQPASDDPTDFDVPLFAYGTAWDRDMD